MRSFWPLGLPPIVTAYDVLSSLTKFNPGDFEQFCGDFGYNADSRNAEAVWRAVTAEWKRVKGFFTAAELAQLQEIENA